MKIWFIEDDKNMWSVQEEGLKEKYPTASIEFFLNAGYAAQAGGSPTYIILDVGGAFIGGCSTISLQVANVGGLSKLHPGAIFIIFSALGYLAREVVEEIKEREMELDAVVDMSNSHIIDDICEVIQKYET